MDFIVLVLYEIVTGIIVRMAFNSELIGVAAGGVIAMFFFAALYARTRDWAQIVWALAYLASIIASFIMGLRFQGFLLLGFIVFWTLLYLFWRGQARMEEEAIEHQRQRDLEYAQRHEQEETEMFADLARLLNLYRHREGKLPGNRRYHVFTADAGKHWFNARWTHEGCVIESEADPALLAQIPNLEMPASPLHDEPGWDAYEYLQRSFIWMVSPDNSSVQYALLSIDGGANWHETESTFDAQGNPVDVVVIGPASRDLLARAEMDEE